MSLAMAGQGLGPEHIGKLERAVKMREERATTGWLPLYRLNPLSLHGKQHKAFDTCKIFRSGLSGLRGGRKMDVSISKVNGGTKRFALGL